MTSALLGLDLLLTVLGAVLWLAAGVRASSSDTMRGSTRKLRETMRRDALIAAWFAAAAAAVSIGRVLVVTALARHGWAFVQEKVWLALPLLLVPAGAAAVLAGPALARLRPVPVRGRLALLTTGYGAVAGAAVAFVIGYPATWLSGAVMIALVGAVAAITWQVLTGRARTLTIVPLASAAVLVVAGPLTVAAVRSDAAPVHQHGAAGRLVNQLRTPASSAGPVKRFTLTAGRQRVTLPSGRDVDAWTFGSLPGPPMTVAKGDLVEVELRNTDIAEGVTLHWHGYDVPNGEDGVAGVTQDAVLPGQSFRYRLLADQAGTYWYHTHQHSSEGVRRGLFGTLVVLDAPPTGVDLTIPIHTLDGAVLVGESDHVMRTRVEPGQPVRLRLVNTDTTPHRLSLSGVDFRIVAVDGRDLVGERSSTGKVLRIPAGGRYDVSFSMSSAPVRLGVAGGGGAGLVLAPGTDSSPAPFVDGVDLDLLGHGTTGDGATGHLPTVFDRDETIVLDRQLRFIGGVPRYAHTVNGQAYPHVPPIVVNEGDLVRLTVVNRSSETHPMHPHGHHVLVLSRNGVPPSGGPLWLDTFDVQPGEVWKVALRADNPGVWLAHCHNLDHAALGMVLHLQYRNVRAPFTVGGTTPNRPE